MENAKQGSTRPSERRSRQTHTLEPTEKPSFAPWVADLVADLVTELVFVTDVEGRFVRVNKAFEECLGYQAEELLGQPDALIHPPEEQGKMEAMRGAAWEKAFVSRVDTAYLTKAGKRVPVSATIATLRDHQGNPTGLITMARNMSQVNELIADLQTSVERMEKANRELRETQEQLMQAEKLALVGQLAATVSHELRNPLGVIQNVAYFLQMRLGDTDETARRQLAILQREVTACSEIISELLDLSRRRPPNLALTDLHAALDEALLRSAVPENVRVTKKWGDEIPPIMADAGQLVRVWTNLIANAVQAMEEGGEISITTKKSDAFVEVGVHDTGRGIPEEDISRVFEPLFTTKAHGIGLGLVVSKSLVEGHQGTISVESQPGKGSHFTVRLPIGQSVQV